MRSRNLTSQEAKNGLADVSVPHPILTLTDVTDIAQLQNSQTGTFAGDEWGESDTRFLYCAFNALSILDLMNLIDVDKAISHVQQCANFDGAYGVAPGAESHAGQVFTCVGALSIARRLDLVDVDRLGSWLSERQLPNGGLNGRPEKLEDVCYSWWVMSSMAMIKKLHWIDSSKLSQFILRCQVGMTAVDSLEGADFDDRTLSTVELPIDLEIWSTCSIQCSVSQV